MTPLSAIYYPFSRCIDAAALKQLLLVFDSVTFMDPVADDDWRAYLMEEMIEQEDQRFANYRDIHKSLDRLRDEGAICIKDPVSCVQNYDLVTASALSDLSDSAWCRVAARPQDYGMPHRHYARDGSATWQIFKPKLPDGFIEILGSNEFLKRHIVHLGNERTSTTLTYEAGSAVSISLYLSAAENLALAPVTDSVMHHQLMLQKAMRCHYGEDSDGPVPLPPTSISHLANQSAFNLVQGLLPKEFLNQVSLDQVLRFRAETAEHRNVLISDLNRRLELRKSDVHPEKLHQLQAEIRSSIITELRQFQNAVSEAKDKIWPNLVGATNKSLAAGGIAAVGFNLIGGPGQILAASILASSLAFLKELLDIRREVRKAERSASPAITYLSKVQSFGI